MLSTRRRLWEISGSGYLTEYKFIIWFYKRTTVQKWSPLLHEYNVEYGIRISHIKFNFCCNFKKWLDSKEPKIEYGSF